MQVILLAILCVLVGVSGESSVVESDGSVRNQVVGGSALAEQHARNVYANRGQLSPQHPPRVGLTFNVAVDRVTRMTPVLRELLSKNSDVRDLASSSLHATNHVAPKSVIEVLETIAYHFERGSAAERSLADRDVFDAFLNSVTEAAEPEDRIGGNAALMARRMGELNMTVGVTGMIGPIGLRLLQRPVVPAFETRARVNRGFSFAGSVSAESEMGGSDDIHLILEFSTGESLPFGSFGSAPRSNRFILTRVLDPRRSTLPISILLEQWRDLGHDAIVFAGAHTLQGPSPKLSDLGVMAMRREMQSIPPAVARHLELASIPDQDFLQVLTRDVFPRIDSIGLNEEELLELYLAAGGSFVDEIGGEEVVAESAELGKKAVVKRREDLVGSSPSPRAVASAIRFIFRRYYWKISRIHFHSLSFHLIAQRGGSMMNWREPGRAVAAGSIAATLAACGEDPGDLGNVYDSLPPHGPVQLLAPLDLDVSDPELASWANVPVSRGPGISLVKRTATRRQASAKDSGVVRWRWPLRPRPAESNAGDRFAHEYFRGALALSVRRRTAPVEGRPCFGYGELFDRRAKPDAPLWLHRPLALETLRNMSNVAGGAGTEIPDDLMAWDHLELHVPPPSELETAFASDEPDASPDVSQGRCTDAMSLPDDEKVAEPFTGTILAKAKEDSVIEFAYAPVAVCEKPSHTVGLGDIISATGLSSSLPPSRFYNERRDGHGAAFYDVFRQRTVAPKLGKMAVGLEPFRIALALGKHPDAAEEEKEENDGEKGEEGDEDFFALIEPQDRPRYIIEPYAILRWMDQTLFQNCRDCGRKFPTALFQTPEEDDLQQHGEEVNITREQLLEAFETNVLPPGHTEESFAKMMALFGRAGGAVLKIRRGLDGKLLAISPYRKKEIQHVVGQGPPGDGQQPPQPPPGPGAKPPHESAESELQEPPDDALFPDPAEFIDMPPLD